MRATEITENLREYLKNVDFNTLDLFRKEGKIEFNLQSELEKALQGVIEPSSEVSDDDHGVDDEDMRMKFDQMDLEDGDGDEEELNDEDIEELQKELKKK